MSAFVDKETQRFCCGIALTLRVSVSLAIGFGGASCTEDSSHAGGDPHPVLRFDELEVEQALVGVSDMAAVPGRANELLVLSQEGAVAHYLIEEDRVAWLGQFTVPRVHVLQDCGLLSIAFDPSFAETGYFYLAYCLDETGSESPSPEEIEDTNRTSVVQRFVFDASNYEAIGQSAEQIISIEHRGASARVHALGSMGFEQDGTMWLLSGDRGLAHEAQNAKSPLGSVLRFRGAGQNPPILQPAEGNPGGDAEEGLERFVYAKGLRSPWRGSLDSQGRLWVANVGSDGDSAEEIDVVHRPGQNFGWPLHEGPCTGDCSTFVDPAFHWHRQDETHPYLLDDPEADGSASRVAWVGPHYNPVGYEDRYEDRLTAKTLFGDLCLGFIRAGELDADNAVVTDEPVGHLSGATAWAIATDGYLYAASFGACVSAAPAPSRIYRAQLR